ncbi:hypothetical protein [Allosphingosinicella vermicomposti]|uniref:hypothetical protein n=1 Tax=Allosphingosinicella vermicomposti TaxID=614671 RepID=UPI00131A5B33|nr:hypothetical protein [Allosphingosinicella vermicomposti]
MSILFVALSLLATMPIGSDVKAETNTSAMTAPTEAPKEERKICKKIEASESRLAGKRVCLTAAEWKRQSN